MAQVLRRGGLKSDPKVDPKAVDGRIAQLRARAKAEDSAKKGGKAGTRAGEVPMDYSEIQYTEMEQELNRAMQGAGMLLLL